MITFSLPISVFLDNGKIMSFRDIFVFRNIMSTMFYDDSQQIRYSIMSEDTPKSISLYMYGTEFYDWTIYCLNNIVNPYYEWPMSEINLNSYLNEKYFGKSCLFLTSVGDNFNIGDIIYNSSGSAAKVVDWDRTLGKLTVLKISGNFSINESIITNTTSNGTVKRIIDKAEEALHHFETPLGVDLDPYAGPLQSYLNNTDETYVITNRQYEEKVNDSKRLIYLVRPEYMTTFQTRLTGLMTALHNKEVENIVS